MKLTSDEKEIVRNTIKKELYTKSLYEFFKASCYVLYPSVEWDFNFHFKYICDLLQDEVIRIIANKHKQHDYIINLPFRSGKSILLSQIFPVWVWVKKSELSVMQVSHSETLAVKHSHASKMLIESEWFCKIFPQITLRQDTHAKANYMNQAGGKRISFGVRSGIIGEGCNIQIIDDINNPADSQAVTATINEVYTDTLYSRLNNPEVDLRIILQQRVAENDICGFLINKSPNKYFHICLPARMDSNISPAYLVEQYKDGLFWRRFNDKVLQDFQETLGSRAYSGQLMQKPVAEQGTIIQRKWFNQISYAQYQEIAATNKLEYYAFIDTAYTDKTLNDPTAILICFKYNNALYILKTYKVWQQFPDLINYLKKLKQQFQLKILYIETKASGISIMQQLRRDGLNVGELSPDDKDKITRVNAVTPTIEGGRVYLIEDVMNETFLQECAGFPFGADDLVDCLAYACDKLLNKITGMKYAKG